MAVSPPSPLLMFVMSGRVLRCLLLLLPLLHNTTATPSLGNEDYSIKTPQMFFIQPGYGNTNASNSHAAFRVRRASDNIRTSPYTADEKQALLDIHNTMRSDTKAADMLVMEWDDDLATEAQRWADRCDFAHPTQSRQIGEFNQIGQNLYVGTHQSSEITDPVQLWYDEISDYTYNTNGCTPGKMCGHYTQVVWAKSKAVGCAIKYCDPLTSVNSFNKGYLVVCEYGPAGNFIDQKPYQKGTVCSKCPAEYQYCVKNLCSKSEAEDSGTTPTTTTTTTTTTTKKPQEDDDNGASSIFSCVTPFCVKCLQIIWSISLMMVAVSEIFVGGSHGM